MQHIINEIINGFIAVIFQYILFDFYVENAQVAVDGRFPGRKGTIFVSFCQYFASSEQNVQ
jgi:hypothetical protein